MRNKNGRTRIQFTRQEIAAMRTVVCDRLRGQVTSKVRAETLGGIVMKLGRASNRIKAVPA
ncbi:hypothetical protein ES703_28922 [subsurface metagenome]